MPRTARQPAVPLKATPHEGQNHVRLAGRLTALEARTLPSGDDLVALRLVVPRPRARGGGPTIDTIDCTVWRAELRRRVLSWQPGDVVEVEGALRRRFWRGSTGVRSRYDVEVSRARRMR